MQPDLEQRVRELEQRLETFERKYTIHQHDGVDGTGTLHKNIRLDRDQWLSVGPMQNITQTTQKKASVDEFYINTISVGSDDPTVGFTNKSNNMQLNFVHRPNSTSYLMCFKNPLVTSVEGTSISTTAAGDTITISGFNFTTNELTGALINIYNSSNVLVETQTIASNTSTVITISGVWLNSTSSGKFQIYNPVHLGFTTEIFNRLYVQEGTTVGGVRFGVGATANGQNGLLYMDATGDIYWQNKGGTSTKLN